MQQVSVKDSESTLMGKMWFVLTQLPRKALSPPCIKRKRSVKEASIVGCHFEVAKLEDSQSSSVENVTPTSFCSATASTK